MIDNPAWAAELWERARPLIPSPFPTASPPHRPEPEEVAGYPAVGLNERFRFYRYDPGQTFRPHTDGHFARNDERSQLTFMVYLNGECGGGETVVHFQNDGLTRPDWWELRVKPEAGKALVFYHYLLHEGAPVTAGRKYVLRTDVMYRGGRGG
jgi:predicted 2-oxoglutarate/Fe(II)-dependent dioxygenase YbiX